MIQLYEFARSGNCHKVRLMLSFLGLSYQSIPVNGNAREHKSRDFLAMNPLGQVPVLNDDGTVIRDSQAILIYLAHRYGGEKKWWTNDSVRLAEITAWLFTAANEVARGPNALRLHHQFGRPINPVEAEEITEKLLNIIEEQLSKHDWIVSDAPTIADIALYPYIELAHEGKVNLSPFSSVLAWLARFKALPGYVSMPGM